MGDVVNLRLARKAKARDAAQGQAASNRAKFGRTKTEKQRDARETARAERLLEGARRDTGRETD
ncbi:DUF4169 family protein [Novosphingobium sp. UBA1939]|uniref:DUF4169 family protein n=1 Tax=Novosphingobium sp. UBA1939 TaxID=1946982 RepID=UPI0025D820ED|nr:DUF4169 family protein [Novosphingobium sp. UBA1939]